jgi:ubiquinone/menaquinone biosynthesis C-methylase UbiE
MIEKTIDFYNSNANKLLNDYEKADMHKAYLIIEKYLKDNDTILDVGFGSGRDLNYFINKNINVYGIDGSESFLSIFKDRYPSLSKNVFYSKLPAIVLPSELNNNHFDLIFSMATWMHIPKRNHQETISNIKRLLKPQGILVLAYSCEERKNDPRFFEKLTPQYVKEIFKRNEFELLDSIITEDALNRKAIKWVTQVYKLKNY